MSGDEEDEGRDSCVYVCLCACLHVYLHVGTRVFASVPPVLFPGRLTCPSPPLNSVQELGDSPTPSQTPYTRPSPCAPSPFPSSPPALGGDSSLVHTPFWRAVGPADFPLQGSPNEDAPS